MDLSLQAIQCAMAQNLQKMLPYWKQTISKMEACLEKIEALPPYENREKSPIELKILGQEQAEIFKDVRDIFSKFAFFLMKNGEDFGCIRRRISHIFLPICKKHFMSLMWTTAA